MTTTAPDPAAVLGGDTAPPFHPSATDEQRALLEWADAHPIERPTIEKDGNGRYKATPPGGTKPKGHTRVTTFAEALDDSEGLTVWRHRLLAAGLVSTDAMVAAARRAVDADDKRQLSASIAAALHHAGEKLLADCGSAIHLALEHAIAGTGERPPAPYDADVDAIVAAMAAAGLRTSVEMSERCVYVPDHELIGTGDLFVDGDWGPAKRVADLKTGSSYERIGYGIQLPCYAHASHLWDGERWVEAPAIDKAVGYVIHAPLGTGTCSIVEVDLVAGWELASLAAKVRAARSAPTVRSLFTVVAQGASAHLGEPTIVEQLEATLTNAERSTWLVGRIRTITDTDDRALLARKWPTGCPNVPPWTDAQIDAIEALVAPLEPTFAGPDPTAVIEVPASEPEPTPAPRLWEVDDDGTKATEAQEAAVAAAFDDLDQHGRALVGTWVGDAKRGGRHFALGPDQRTARTVAIQAACVACARHLHDHDEPELLTRVVLASVLGEDLQPGWRTGAVLGSLTFDQAKRLTQIADAFGRSEPDAMATVGHLVAAHTAA